MKSYPLADDLVRPVLRVTMPRAPRIVAPGGTVLVVARCNNREFGFTSAADFEVLPPPLQRCAGEWFPCRPNFAHFLASHAPQEAGAPHRAKSR